MHSAPLLPLVPALLAVPLLAQEPEIDLSDERVDPSRLNQKAEGPPAAQAMARRWFENFEIWGFAAAGYLDTGSAGYRPKGAFLLKEAKIYIEAEAWQNVSVFTELQFSKAGMPDDGRIRTQETYLHLRDVFGPAQPGRCSLKLGIMDIPFGEEYLRQDSADNPMLNYPAAFPYGWDEGLLLYGEYGGLDWFAAVMDGSFGRNEEDSNDKAFALKLGTDLGAHGRISASLMHTGSTARSANCFSGRYLDPVGADGLASSAGASASAQIEALLYQVDCVYDNPQGMSLRLFAGQARIDDQDASFDRELSWFSLEHGWQLGEGWRLTGRISEFGTYDDDEGYALQGRITADGAGAYGYDSKRLQRLALALQHRPNPRTWIKAELGRDRYWMIDGSGFAPGSVNGVYLGLELGVSF